MKELTEADKHVSLWFSRLQILQHGRSCSLQYKLNFSWCSSQCSLISNTYDGSFWYSSIGMVAWFRDSFTKLWYSNIEHLIEEMIEVISKIRQNREANSSSVKEQKRIIENEIQELRTKINNHLDRLQENLIFWQRSSHNALIQQLFLQTFECWWLNSSNRCLSYMIVWFDSDGHC
jgi:hypothetical protein